MNIVETSWSSQVATLVLFVLAPAVLLILLWRLGRRLYRGRVADPRFERGVCCAWRRADHGIEPVAPS
jgi:hypothetical protein